MNRENAVNEFVQKCIGDYSVLNFDIRTNDDSDDSYTDFDIIITNNRNENTIIEVLRCWDYEGGIEILKGEDFYSTDEQDFIMCLFLDRFLT